VTYNSYDDKTFNVTVTESYIEKNYDTFLQATLAVIDEDLDTIDIKTSESSANITFTNVSI